jgi:hypothetical protein
LYVHDVVGDGSITNSGASQTRVARTAGLSTPLILVVLSGLYAAVISVSAGRHLWLDELLTYHLAKLPTISEMFRAALRFDLNPPLFHLLARAGLRLAGGHPTGVRIPSEIEFYFAGVLLFFYTQRKMGVLWAALPVLLLWYGPMSQYATEGRPYAALCFWFAALLLLWDTAVHRTKRTGILVAMAACSLGMLASHVFGTLTLFAFFCAEAARFRERRRADWALWAALFAPLVFTAVYLPLFASYNRFPDFPTEFQASPRKLGSFYWHNFTGVVMCLAVMAAAIWIVRRRHKSALVEHTRETLRTPELVLFLVQAVLPVLLTLIFMLQHGAFWGRYCITSIVALYLLAGYALARLAQGDSNAARAAFWAGSLVVLAHGFVWPLWQQKTSPPPDSAAVLERVKPDLPLAAASGLTFIEMSQYESPRLLDRLYYLQDQAAAIRLAHASMFNDLANLQLVFHLPGHVVPYADFVAEHRHFLVLATPGYPEDWLLRKLQEDHAEVRRLGRYRIPYKDTQLFEVWLGRVNGARASDPAGRAAAGAEMKNPGSPR